VVVVVVVAEVVVMDSVVIMCCAAAAWCGCVLPDKRVVENDATWKLALKERLSAVAARSIVFMACKIAMGMSRFCFCFRVSG
jgi:hypothetical protein